MKCFFFMILLISVNAFGADTQTDKSDTPENSQQGLKVTPSMLTVNNDDTSKDKATTTPGLEFTFNKKWGQDESYNYKGYYAALSALGRVAFDQKQHVGDLIDLNVSANYQYRYGGGVTANFKPEAIGFLVVSLKGGIQSDQKFETKQKVLTAELQGYFAPQDTPGPLRHLLPYITFGYDRVDPKDDEARKKIDPTLSAYNRLHARLSASTIVGKIDGHREVKLSFKIDHWRERTPSPPIQLSNLDRQTYRALSLHEASAGDDAGWTLSYSSGKVPTDQVASKVWAIGYTVTLK